MTLQTAVLMKDHGLPVLTATSPRLYINVKDINDNPPEFRPDMLSVGVKENTYNVTVTTVKAYDNDTDSEIAYSLNGKFVFIIM